MNKSELDAVHADIKNWVRCVRGGFSVGHCASVEGRYRAERGEGLEARRQPRIDVQEARAWLVEAAWRSLPTVDRWLLKLAYVWNQPDHMVIRGISHHTGEVVKRWHFKARELHSLTLLKRAIDKRESQSVSFAPQFETADVKRDSAPQGVAARPAKTEAAAA